MTLSAVTLLGTKVIPADYSLRRHRLIPLMSDAHGRTIWTVT